MIWGAINWNLISESLLLHTAAALFKYIMKTIIYASSSNKVIVAVMKINIHCDKVAL